MVVVIICAKIMGRIPVLSGKVTGKDLLLEKIKKKKKRQDFVVGEHGHRG